MGSRAKNHLIDRTVPLLHTSAQKLGLSLILMNRTDAPVRVIHYPASILEGQGSLEFQLTVELRITCI